MRVREKTMKMNIVHELVRVDVISFVNGEKGINFNLKKNIEKLYRIYESPRSGPKLVIPCEQSNHGITNYFFHDIMFLCALGHMQWTS